MVATASGNDEERRAIAALRSLLGTATKWRLTEAPRRGAVDFLLENDSLKLAVEMKRSSDAAAIQKALHQVEEYRRAHPEVIPLVATSFMGPVGKQLCAERRVGWFDLSGNADIDAPGLRVLIEGRPNQFKRTGRPSSVFSPKASRIARWLLMHGDAGWTQQQLTESTRLDKGYASRVLKRLREQGFVYLRGDQYFVHSRDTLLDVWRAQYEFSKHRIIKGVMPVRSGEEAIRKIAAALAPESYVATGLAGAWFVDKFATFRTATVYVREEPSEALHDALSFVPTEKGANTWLVRPNDDGVFDGRGEEDGVMCAHPVQIYMDLKAQPERASEAAEHLRGTQLNWSGDAE